MDTDDLATFLDVVETGSLSAAAKLRGLAVSTIARRLDALEARLRVRLVDRGRNGIRPTAHGERILGLAEPLVRSAQGIERVASALRDDALEEIVVTATEFIVADVLAPAIDRLRETARDVRLDLRSEPAVVSLAGREADLAVRMSRPEGASIVAKRLPGIALGLFASQAYVGKRDPASFDLHRERLLVYNDGYGPLAELDWLRQGLAAAVACRTNSTRALLNMAVAGNGIALLPALFAERAGLIRVPTSFNIAPRVPWLLVHADLRRRPEVRIVHRWIERTFAELGRSGRGQTR
jgi:DNA-binding transcriptional LysR family regulator